MTKILVRKGTYAGQTLTNRQFDMILPPRMGKKGMYVTVNGAPLGFLKRQVRIMLENEADMSAFFDPAELLVEPEAEVIVPAETDAQIIQRMRKKFGILDGMTLAAIQGSVRAMIVSGPPGVGKSFGVEKVIESLDLMVRMGLVDEKTIKPLAKKSLEKVASASPLGLYQLLWEFSAPGSLLVLDDSDSILYDDVCLNMLKAVTDSGKKRKLSWRTESRVLEERGIPSEFEFDGAIIFITNLDFDSARGKVGEHLKAIVSRCHYLDLEIHGAHEKFLRCKQIVRDGMLESYKFTDVQIDEILTYIETNKRTVRELSLRMVGKIADLVRMDPTGWREYANNTCLKGK